LIDHLPFGDRGRDFFTDSSSSTRTAAARGCGYGSGTRGRVRSPRKAVPIT
jgi:hypothetical protein